MVLEGGIIAPEVFAVGNNAGDDAMSRDLTDEGNCADECGGLDQRHFMLEDGWGSKRLESGVSESVTIRDPKRDGLDFNR